MLSAVATNAERRAGYAARHPDRVVASRAKYLANNRQAVLEAQAAYRAANRGKIQAAQAKRRQRLDVLRAQPCTDCGGRFPPECMDFDHVRGEKKHEISKMTCASDEDLAAEVAKCELVCANCHRTRTRNRKLLLKHAA